jgi:hypothetical protein
MKRAGRKSASQTPAPKSEGIYGSRTNKSGSASSKSKAKRIFFGSDVREKIKNKLAEYNAKNPTRKIDYATAKAIVRRGMGAYSRTHRPTISGGAPNSRSAWGLARLHAFMRKKSGSTTAKGVVRSALIKKAYVQDDDLL